MLAPSVISFTMIVTMSQARFYHEAGYNHRIRVTRRWMEKSDVIQKIQKVTLSPKTSSYTAYAEYAKHILANRYDVMAFYDTTRFKRLQFWTYIRRQKAYEKIVQDLTGGNPENTVIVWGDASFQSSMLRLILIRPMHGLTNRYSNGGLKMFSHCIVVANSGTVNAF